MYVSAEIITMLATAATLLVAIISGFGWMVNRMDARFEAQEAKYDARFDRIDERFDRIHDRLRGVEIEMTEVKVAVARLEGPTPRLMTVR